MSIQVECPERGTQYEDWYRGSINLALDDFDDEYLEQATTATCPKLQDGRQPWYAHRWSRWGVDDLQLTDDELHDMVRGRWFE